MDNRKRQRKNRLLLSAEQKIELLQKLDSGVSVMRLTVEYGIGTTTIYDLKRQRDKFLECYDGEVWRKISKNKRKPRKAKKKELDEVLIEWARQQKHELLTGPVLIKQARIFHQELNIQGSQDDYSEEWLKGFTKHHNIKYLQISDEKGSIEDDHEQIENNLCKTEPSSLGYPEQTEVTPTVKQSPNRSPYGVSSIQPESLSYPTPAKLQKKNEQQFLEEIRQASFSQSGLIGEPAVEFPQHFSSHVAEPAASLATPVLVAPPKPVEKPRIIEKRIIVVADHQRCVMSNLASLWKSGKLCDAGIGNGSSTVMVHKVVLSAMCPKLISVFSKDMISHKFLQVNFPSQVSTEALNAFAEYMYNGILDLDPDILQQLKIIAKRLDMKEFEQLCDSHLPNQHHQPVAAAATSSISFNNLPLIQTSVPIIPSIPTSHQTLNISSSVGSDSSATNQMIDVKPQISKADLPQLQKDPAAVFGKESVLTSSAPNQSAIGPSIKAEPLGPDDHKYGHIESVSNHEALPQSSLSSSSIPTSSIAAPSTDFTIPFSEAPDVKPIILKVIPSTNALPVSDTSLVPSSQSASVKETNWQPSFTVSAAGQSLTNEMPYPIEIFTAKGDNILLRTQENNMRHHYIRINYFIWTSVLIFII